MTSHIQLGKNPLISIKEAVLLVPYSRDYITRLAREEKIVALQFNRQWLVDPTSLVNFFNQAKIEENVRRRHLSELRRREIEVRDEFIRSLEILGNKQVSSFYITHVRSFSVVACGLMVGILFYLASTNLTPNRIELIAQLPQSFFTIFNRNKLPENPVIAAISNTDVFYEAQEITESMPLSQGILLSPASTTASLEDLGILFSDEVRVEMLSTTTGVVYLNHVGAAPVPFVRVPSDGGSSVEVTP